MNYLGIVWAGLLVADLEGAINFYRNILELPLIEGEERCAMFDAGNGAVLELWPAGFASTAPKTPKQQSLRIAFKVENLDETIAALQSRGVQFIGEVGEYAGDRWIYFADPEGNRLELKETFA